MFAFVGREEVLLGKLFANVDWKVFGSLIVLVAGVVVLWDTFAVYPLKILVVFFHELSHGLAAVVTGGEIERIQLVAAQGGLCVTLGGSRFVILTAGYLGSLVFGGVILLLAARTRIDRVVSIVLGCVLLLVTIAFIRPVLGFGFGFGLAAGLILVAVGAFLSGSVNDYLLKAIGLTSCLYAVMDIKSDVLDRPELRSDARVLGDLTGLPTAFWGVLWIVVAVVAALIFLLFACQRGKGQQGQTESQAKGAGEVT